MANKCLRTADEDLGTNDKCLGTKEDDPRREEEYFKGDEEDLGLGAKDPGTKKEDCP